MDEQNYITIEEAADLVNKSPRTIYRWGVEGRVGTQRSGDRTRGGMRVNREDVLNQITTTTASE